jgi:hypothetical protein
MASTAQINIKVDEKSAQNSVDNLNKSLNQSTKSTTSLRAELRQITQELQGLEPGSKRFDELNQRAGQLRDTIQDTSAVIKATAGSAIENLGSGLQGVASTGVAAFQGLQAAAVLFGDENENLQKQMVKLQAVANLAQAINTFGGLKDTITTVTASFKAFSTQIAASTIVSKIYNFVMQETTLAQVKETASSVAGSIATGIQTAATTLLTVAKRGLTTATISSANAMRVLKGAIVATGIGALVVLLGEAISYLMDMGNEAESAAEKQEKIAQAAEKTRQKLQDAAAAARTLSEMMTGGLTDMENELKLLEARGAGFNVVYDQQVKILNERNTLLNNQAFKENIQLANQASDYTGKMLTRYLELKKEQKAINTDMELANIKRSDAAKQESEDAARAAQEAADKRKQQSDDAARERERLEKERQDRRRKEIDDLNTILDREKYAREELAKVYTTQDEVEKGIFQKRTKREEEMMNLQIEMDDFEKDLINKATERKIQALEEDWVKGKKTIQQFQAERLILEQNGADNLLPVEKALLDKKEQIFNMEVDKRQENWDRLKEQAIINSDIINTQTAQSRVNFEKEMALRDIELMNVSEEKKKKLRLETLQYYEDTEISQITQINNKSLDLLYEQYKTERKLAEENGDDLEVIDAKYQNDRVNLELDASKKIRDIQDAALVDREKNFQENIKLAEEQLNMWGGKVMEIADAINALYAQQTQQQIDMVNSRYQTESDKLQAQFDQRLISEEEFNAQKKAMEQQREQDEISLKRKQFNRDKANNIVNAIMLGAQSVLAALATMPPASYIMAALNAGLAAVQVATISQQQFKAARGGIVPGNGNGSVDSVPSMLAPGEAVINSNSAAMFPNTLSLINQAGGGISLAPEMPTQGSSGSGTVFADNRSNQPVKAYVVETEITSSQKRVNRIERSVEF